jgi:hypothetical protein
MVEILKKELTGLLVVSNRQSGSDELGKLLAFTSHVPSALPIAVVISVDDESPENLKQGFADCTAALAQCADKLEGDKPAFYAKFSLMRRKVLFQSIRVRSAVLARRGLTDPQFVDFMIRKAMVEVRTILNFHFKLPG